MTALHDRVASVTERIRQRSHDRRQAYLDDITAMEDSPDSDRRQRRCARGGWHRPGGWRCAGNV
jgi:hypothetical protein